MAGQHEKAEECYATALKLAPREASLWFEAGMCEARHKQWDSALERLGKAVELDSKNHQYVANYGLCLALAGRYDEALSWLKKGYSEAEAHFNLARTLHRIHQDEMAQRETMIALQIDPSLAPARELLDELTAPPASLANAPGSPSGR
jgi:tetratricopeptide (TPR) repeat protein